MIILFTLVTLVTALAVCSTAVLGTVAAYETRRELKDARAELEQVRRGTEEVHELVNATHSDLTRRVEQLIQALAASGVAVPADPNQQPKEAP